MPTLKPKLFRFNLHSLLPFLSPFSSSCTRSPPPPPPRASPAPVQQPPPVPKKIPFTVSAHRRSWVDPYHWMSNTDDPDLVDYLSRENSYAAAFMADTGIFQRRLVAEMKGRMPTRVSTPPEGWGPWLYYQYVPEEKEYPVLCRRLGSYDGFGKTAVNFMRRFRKEEVLLNWNEIAEQFGYVHIGTCRVSPNHKFLAYTLDISGDEIFILQIKDIRTGHVLQSSKVEGVVSVAWARDSSSLLYTACDQTLRPCRVFCKKMGSDEEDDLIFEEHNASCCVDITSTKDGKFITINSNSRSSSEVHVMSTSDIQSGPHLVKKRMAGVQYFLEHHDGSFYILTNAPSENTHFDVGDYHLARCRAGDFPLDDWQDIVLPGKDITFQDMDMFHGHLVLFLHRKGLPVLCSIDMPIIICCKEPVNVEHLHPWFFPLPSIMCNVAPGSNLDYFTSSYRAVISSLMMPDMVVDYDMSKRKFGIVHQEEVVCLKDIALGLYADNENFDTSEVSVCNDENVDLQSWGTLSEAFVCERKEVVSHDGSRIPLTILYSPSATCNGQSPGLLHGYGAYGEALDKSWCADRISLLNRGWVIAFADVRGGGGGDTSWHHAGVGSNKLNSVHDFFACGKYLKTKGYIHKDRLCAIGFSAGGLLVGATVNMFPDLLSAVILKVPFLDICNTLLDPSLPLTMLDYEEFGDPRVETDFEHLYGYSPYDNISPGVCVPPMLVTASFNDSRVGVWEAAKWVAKVRENSCCSCSRSVILRTNMSGGHFGEGGRYKHCEDTAFEYAFLIKALGMLPNESLRSFLRG